MYLSLEKLYLRGEVAVLTLIVNEAVKRVSMYNIYWNLSDAPQWVTWVTLIGNSSDEAVI